MTLFWIILAAIFGIVIARTYPKKTRQVIYHYKPKGEIMTPSELDLYFKLESACCGKYRVIPQVHLSSLFDGRIKGQNWKSAFYHINGKSVDFVLVDPKTFHIKYAIELDDFTHFRSDRVARDSEVERIFVETAVPLIRLKNTIRKTPQQITDDIKKALDN